MGASDSDLGTGTVIGGYRVDRLISRGGMGMVYRATNLAIGRTYALKVLAPALAEDEAFRQRFRREIRTAASLNHPNVVRIHYAGEHEGLLFLAMELIDGSDLREVNGEEHAYLTDFGIAKHSTDASALTVEGARVGTVDYMAPEQITGDRVDARTDIYALGCVFFQMLTGRVPYRREHSVATLFAHVQDPPPPLEGPASATHPTLGPVLVK